MLVGAKIEDAIKVRIHNYMIDLEIFSGFVD